MSKYLLTMLGFIFTLTCVSCSGPGAGVTIDAPDEAKTELDAGAPAEDYVFYALATSPPVDWEAIQAAGMTICDGRPPLLPQELVALLDGGGFKPGTAISLSTGDFAGVTKGRVESSLDMSVEVSVGITLEGCIAEAIKKMEATPGLVLLTENDADFEGKRQLVEVIFD